MKNFERLMIHYEVLYCMDGIKSSDLHQTFPKLFFLPILILLKIALKNQE